MIIITPIVWITFDFIYILHSELSPEFSICLVVFLIGRDTNRVENKGKKGHTFRWIISTLKLDTMKRFKWEDQKNESRNKESN